MSGYHTPDVPHKVGAQSILDALAREGAQRMLMDALAQEIEEFLGRARYERHADQRRGYRNGVGKPRKVAVGCGTLEVRAPRVRDAALPFSSAILPRYQRSSDTDSERIRTVDLRITSACSRNPPRFDESPKAQNPNKIETPEAEGDQ
jgi:transposase-like protein